MVTTSLLATATRPAGRNSVDNLMRVGGTRPHPMYSTLHLRRLQPVLDVTLWEKMVKGRNGASRVRNAEVRGSIPLSSTNIFNNLRAGHPTCSFAFVTNL